MFVIACGAMVKSDEMLGQLRNVAMRSVFVSIIIPIDDSSYRNCSMEINDSFAFGQANLISGYLNTFAVNFGNTVLFDGFPCGVVIEQLLNRSMIGLHTDVIYLSGTRRDGASWIFTSRHYIWTHDTMRPNGTAYPMQCPSCLRVRPWVVPDASYHRDTPMVLRCKNCHAQHTITEMSEEFKAVHNPFAGVWMVKSTGASTAD